MLELAMRGFGQIAELAAIARPQIGVVTNVGPVHLELVDSLEGVARAKGELIAALPPGGTAIVPSDFPVARDDVDVVRVGEPAGDARRRSHGRRRSELQLHRSAPGAERSDRARRARRARPAAAGIRRRRLRPLAWGGGGAPGRRPSHQRRLQREPGLHARRPRVSRRAGRGPAARRDPRRHGRARAHRARSTTGRSARPPPSWAWTSSSPSASSPAGTLRAAFPDAGWRTFTMLCGRWTSSSVRATPSS